MATTQKNGPKGQQQQQPGQQGAQQGEQQRSTQVARRDQPQQMGRPLERSRLERMSSLSPFSLMRRVFEDMERMVEGLVPRAEAEQAIQPGAQRFLGLEWIPRIDVSRHDHNLIVRVDLPGTAPDQVRVFIQPDVLVIEGERRMGRDEEDEDVYQAERIYGRFRRVIALPEGVDVDRVEARFENGVLEISLPMQAPEGRRQISIQTGAPSGETQRPQAQAQAQPQSQQPEGSPQQPPRGKA